jgi:chromosome segregation ATPase
VTKSLTERLSTLATELNDKAVKAAERRVTEILRAAGEQREQAERELADAAQTVDDLETRLTEKRSEASSLAQHLNDAQALAQAQSLEIAQLRERLAAEEKVVHGLQARVEEMRAETSGLTQRLAEAQAVAEAEALETTQFRERLAAAEKAREASAAEHAAEVARLNGVIDSERRRHEERADHLRSEIERRQAELATLKAEAKAAEQVHQEQRKQAAQELHRQGERLMKVEAQREEAHKDAAAAREETAELRGRVGALQSQIVDLTRALAERQVTEPAPGQKPTKGKKSE